ncbi:FGGY-family carbohydrate kinase [Acidisoma sp. 7E03]
MAAAAVLAIDQGTSGTKAVLVDATGAIRARGFAALEETHPAPGWVEQSPEAIRASVRDAVAACLAAVPDIAVQAVGLSTQRESAVLWNRMTGEALMPVMSWQDRRSAELCDALLARPAASRIQSLSGLPLDPMFSAAKFAWALRHHDGVAAAAQAGRLACGTVDAWLLAGFGGEPVTEIGNASRTQLLRTAESVWDETLLGLFGVPASALPTLRPSTGPFPGTRGLSPLPDGTPVLAVMGDSHAALFAHGVFTPGAVKATYGTGSSIMGLIPGPAALGHGLCLTIGWQRAGSPPAFAAEGNVRATGAALRWMARLLGMSVEAMADLGAAAPSRGAALVPAFTGLGAPYWDREARGLIANLTLDMGPEDLARAALEAVVHQVTDVVEAIGSEGVMIDRLFADGGPSRNAALMQMQADCLGCPVLRSETAELSALGVAHLAGLEAGLWSMADLAALPRPHEALTPQADQATRSAARVAWRQAVARARSSHSLQKAAGRAA